MLLAPAQVQHRAAEELQRRTSDQRVLGLLTTNEPVSKFAHRMAELLPALLVRRPALFVDTRELPHDLDRGAASQRASV